jgi:CDP-paratose synthetase
MRILITGANGFLGSSLAHYWAAKGHQLLLLMRPSSNAFRVDGLMDTVHVARVKQVEEISAIIHNWSPNAVVHTACSYGRNGETPLELLDANLRFGIVLIQSILENVSPKDAPISFLNAGTTLAPDISLYALSKTQFSAWGSAIAKNAPDRLQFIDIQLQQMYGPGDDSSKFTTYVIKACRDNHNRLALTAGEQLRDFIHIDDVVSAYDVILNRRDYFSPSDSVEVGTGIAITMREFVEKVKQISGALTELDFGAVPYRQNEAMLCVADTDKLKSLGWQYNVNLTDGLKNLISPQNKNL